MMDGVTYVCCLDDDVYTGERLMARVFCICRPSEIYPVDKDVHYTAGERSKGSCIKGSMEKTLPRIVMAAGKNFHVAQQQDISSFSRKAGFILDKWYEFLACPRGLGWHLAHPNSPLG